MVEADWVDLAIRPLGEGLLGLQVFALRLPVKKLAAGIERLIGFIGNLLAFFTLTYDKQSITVNNSMTTT